MGFDQYAVIKVRDVEPEVFWIVWMDSELPINSFIKTAQNLTEAEVRAELERMSIIRRGGSDVVLNLNVLRLMRRPSLRLLENRSLPRIANR